MKLLVTGGAGFIGSNFIHHMLNKYRNYSIVNVDLLTYSGNLENLMIGGSNNYKFIRADINDQKEINEIFRCEDFDAIVNFAAESHVDRSILNPYIFIKTNILGTQVLLDAANKFNVSKFVQVSTDEVYGSLGNEGLFTENSPIAPNSPYSASKAGADLLVKAYFETFDLNVNITRCSNNYGPFQFPEKLIPLIISNGLENKHVPVYGDGKNVRDWLHVEDHCNGLDLVLHKGKEGEVYNIGGNNERENLDIVRLILKELGKPESLIKFVKDRLGHDRRYAIDSSKISKNLGWKPKIPFEEGIKNTINWYIANEKWLDNIKQGEYQSYYEEQYSIPLGTK
ncbi:dTDP-glucose 4,6-dehydratase [Fictibacillus phosphorivorans]|uniref:dTDP-glucose 4,6-dehydratase n=1 Tax=Fictibacillus phosphorivorans TaxID=1221500 RepID=UPI003CEA87A8